jgi:hypothetical protein
MEGVELVFRGCTPSTEQSAEHSVACAGTWRAGVAESAEPPELGELAGHDKIIGVEARLGHCGPSAKHGRAGWPCCRTR